jgi:hypothetical protein
MHQEIRFKKSGKRISTATPKGEDTGEFANAKLPEESLLLCPAIAHWRRITLTLTLRYVHILQGKRILGEIGIVFPKRRLQSIGNPTLRMREKERERERDANVRAACVCAAYRNPYGFQTPSSQVLSPLILPIHIGMVQFVFDLHEPSGPAGMINAGRNVRNKSFADVG